MAETLKDGTGDGYQARVTPNHQLRMVGVELTEVQDATSKGNSYNINTGRVSLTSTTASGVLYISSDESPVNGESALIIDAIAIGIDSLGTTSGMAEIKIIRNPSSVSFSTVTDMNVNRNYGSSNTLDSLFYKGGEAETVTGGDEFGIFLQNSGTRGFYDVNIEMPKGSSLAITMDTQTTAGTTDVYVAVICHRKDGDNR